MIKVTLAYNYTSVSKKFSTLLALIFLLIPSIAGALQFSDVPEDYIYFLPIQELKQLGLITGYQDGTFHPYDPLTRSIAAWIVLTAYENDAEYHLEIPELDPESTYADMTVADWYAKYLVKVDQMGIWGPDADGKYNPEKPITRSEFFKLVLVPSGLDLEGLDDQQYFPDVPNYAWFAKYMNFAGLNGLVIPDRDQNLYPSQVLSRGEAAEMGYALYLILKSEDHNLVYTQLNANLERALYYLQNGKILAAKRNASFAVGLGQKLINDVPNNDLYLGAAKMAKAINYTINYQILKPVLYQAEQTAFWLDKAQSKVNDALAFDPSLQTLADQIQPYLQ